jgi:hypothetical protein
MVFSHVGRLTLPGLAAYIFTLAACSSSGGNGITPAAMQPASVSRVPFGTSPKAQLYISDSGTNEVETFAWPKPKTGAALSGSFSEPQGMCADRSGDVFITNTGDSNVLEYNNGKLTNTLLDRGQYPVGCSFNTLNGDLAVSNIISTNDGAGSISIYKKAKGPAQDIPVAGLPRDYFLTYDGSSDLFVDGETSSYGFGLAEMKAGSGKFKPICPKLGSLIDFPGGIAWNGKHLVISTGMSIERIRNCKLGIAPIIGGLSDIVSFTIVGNRLVAPDAGSATVEIYSYPKGALLQTLTGFSEPIGAAVAQDVKDR